MKLNLAKISKNSKIAFESKIDSIKKKRVLENFSKLLIRNKNKILEENKKDIKFARKKKIKDNLIKRLEMNEGKFNSIIKSIKEIIKIKDPTNKILERWKRPNGLIIQKVTVPIGVIAVIYESRPNVTSDVASLCFKSGNAVILKGGSEAFNTNKIISDLFRMSLKKCGVDKNYVQFIESKDRKVVDKLLSGMKGYIDLIIPRGGKSLVKKVDTLSKIPYIGHLEGLCHTFIDKNAKLDMAIKVLENAKLRNTSICGATETVLFHRAIAKKFINPVLKNLQNKGCNIYGDKIVKKLFNGKSTLANSKSWSKEYLSKNISAKVVKNLDEAIRHINHFGTMHTDAIITADKNTANYFLKNIKSSIGIHNSSTQFADGGEFGFGAEVGISTNNLPPRGPVGLGQLVSYKYEVYGKGQIRK
ncbi:glutamate-5-semialdehyde dehydrogenase [Candidatus Pelagibacter sp.]|nr:glutamate-5-semialdehyde dehydrogenase [Candidatus Pelagibacter sp.]|tara:strand:+ start:3778 stop:5028 length:1251 start_codon:yes stop_codon:yes gene_type:complete